MYKKLFFISTFIYFLNLQMLNAKQTLCYKENLEKISSIETVILDGGECNSKNKLSDMKNKGWITKDIKITPTNNLYSVIYILEKKDLKTETINETDLINKINAQVIITQKQQKEKKLLEEKTKKEKDIKSFYTKTCQKCHGEKGNLEPYNNSRKLSTLSSSQMIEAINDYNFGDNNRPSMIIMKPYVDFLDSEKLEGIYNYLKTLQ